MTKAKPPAPKIIIGDGTLSKGEEERIALLLILYLAEREIADGKYMPVPVAMKRLRARLRKRQAKKR
jgi:hypothetical protein